MAILERILGSIGDGVVQQVSVGLNWTAVVVQVNGITRCGLSSTQFEGHSHSSKARIAEAGKLEGFTARQLAEYVLEETTLLSSVGMAALNALLPPDPARWKEANAEELILQQGKEKRVALVGHFPFVPHLREQLPGLVVLELEPQEGDLPASMAPQVLPWADVVAITAMTLLNHTLEELLTLCSPSAFVLILGPSAPLSPLLFDFGIDVISGAVVTRIEPVLKTLQQGGNFRQIHQAGVQLVNILK